MYFVFVEIVQNYIKIGDAIIPLVDVCAIPEGLPDFVSSAAAEMFFDKFGVRGVYMEIVMRNVGETTPLEVFPPAGVVVEIAGLNVDTFFFEKGNGG